MANASCASCDGRRLLRVRAGETCPACGGAGSYDYDYGSRVEQTPCLVCEGRGAMSVDEEIRCPRCETFGR